MQQMNISKDEDEEEEEEEEEEVDGSQEIEAPVVKIPDHLVVQTADCSHLSFGSFGSAMNAPFYGSFASISQQSNDVETSTAPSAPPVGYTDARIDYYEDQHRTTSDGNNDHRLAANTGSYDMPSASQLEALKQG